MTYEEAVAQHKTMIFSFAYYYLGNRQEAEDVTQDVLLKLWDHWGTFEEQAVPMWLNRVTRNRSFDLLRSRTRRLKVVSEEDDATMATFAELDEPSPHSVAEQGSMRGHVRRAVARLPEPYRSAVILREMMEQTYHQVAAALEIPLGTAKTHVHRGRKLLRAELQEVLHG